MKSLDQEITKSKERVRDHGEVFTPTRVVKKMLNMPGLREACQDLMKTFLDLVFSNRGFETKAEDGR